MSCAVFWHRLSSSYVTVSYVDLFKRQQVDSLTTFMTTSAAFYTLGAETAWHPWNYDAAFANYIGSARAHKAPVVRSCCKMSRWCTDPGPSSTHHSAQANWRPTEDVGNHDQGRPGAPCPRHDGERTRWRSTELAQDRGAWSASVRDVVYSTGDAGSNLPRECRHK